jgi:hypothetical protein
MDEVEVTEFLLTARLLAHQDQDDRRKIERALERLLELLAHVRVGDLLGRG